MCARRVRSGGATVYLIKEKAARCQEVIKSHTGDIIPVDVAAPGTDTVAAVLMARVAAAWGIPAEEQRLTTRPVRPFRMAMTVTRSLPAQQVWDAEAPTALPASVGAAPRDSPWFSVSANTQGESETDTLLCADSTEVSAGSHVVTASDAEVGLPAAHAGAAPPQLTDAPPQPAAGPAQDPAEPQPGCPRPCGLRWICTPDWMAGVVGVGQVLAILALGRIDGIGSVVPHFLQTWTYNPLDSLYNRTEVNATANKTHTHVTHGADGAGLVLQLQMLAAVMAAVIMGAAWVTGTYGAPNDKKLPRCTVDMLVGWVITFLIAVFSQWLSMQTYFHEYGIDDAVISMLIGMLITEFHGSTPRCLKTVAAQGEWQVKIALTCMIVRVAALCQLGPRGFLTGWIGKPLSVAAVYWFGTAVLGIDQGLAMLVSAGVSWCGATAISAVAPIVQTSDKDTRKTAATGVIALGVIPQTFALGYLARSLPGHAGAIGAWLGLAVDQTGNVLVSGQIADASSRFATATHSVKETAGLVKMTMNAGLGLIVMAIGVFWEERVKGRDGSDPASSGDACRRRLAMLWTNFPKFIIGFILNCAILSWYAASSGSDAAAAELHESANKLCRWWMATGFAAIGLNTDRRKLCEDVKEAGGLLSLFLLWFIGGLIDNIWAFGLAYLGFEVFRE